MARMVNEQEHLEKRNEILDAALQHVYVKGYERMTIQDILADLKISNGAFYHYFDSKQAVLEPLVERMLQKAEQPLLPIIQDANLPAIEKLSGFFGAIDNLRTAQKSFVADFLRTWYADENAILRQKVEAAIVTRRASLLAMIVRQGVKEGVFTTAYSDLAGELILSLLRGMENTHARLLLAVEQEGDELGCIEGIVAAHAAYMDGIERVLGAPSGCLYRTNTEAVKVWVAALRANAR